MNIKKNIELTIDRLPNGYVFTYYDFITEVTSKEAVIKALNRMTVSGRIAKLSKGRYYKPENTPFGLLLPKQYQVVKDLLEENGKTTGYLTGYSIYNQLGLTTQVSNIIQIGKNEIRPKLTRGSYIITFVKQKNTINKDNIPLLQILDSVKNIKIIPDSSIESSCKRFLTIINELSEKEKSLLVRLALKYPPSTRALLGAILEHLKQSNLTGILLKSLNPITRYKLSGAEKVLLTTKKWNLE